MLRSVHLSFVATTLLGLVLPLAYVANAMLANFVKHCCFVPSVAVFISVKF